MTTVPASPEPDHPERPRVTPTQPSLPLKHRRPLGKAPLTPRPAGLCQRGQLRGREGGRPSSSHRCSPSRAAAATRLDEASTPAELGFAPIRKPNVRGFLHSEAFAQAHFPGGGRGNDSRWCWAVARWQLMLWPCRRITSRRLHVPPCEMAHTMDSCIVRFRRRRRRHRSISY